MIVLERIERKHNNRECPHTNPNLWAEMRVKYLDGEAESASVPRCICGRSLTLDLEWVESAEVSSR